MGKPAARLTDIHACPIHPPNAIIQGSPNVFTDSLPAARVTDKEACTAAIVAGSAGVFINGLPAARLSDPTSHGGKIATGSPDVFIGETKSPPVHPKPVIRKGKHADGSAGGASPASEVPEASTGSSSSAAPAGPATGSSSASSSGRNAAKPKLGLKSKKVTQASKPVVKVEAGKASGKKGVKGTWSEVLENPEPNTIYEVASIHNDQPVTYRYETDDQGRTVRVTGKLKKSAISNQKERDKLHRNTTTQSKYGGDDPDYDGGHLIGTLFQGPAEKVNLIPQLASQNRTGDWRQMEKKWATHLDEGNEVEVDIRVEYDPDGHPIKLMSKYVVIDQDGKVLLRKEQPFDN